MKHNPFKNLKKHEWALWFVSLLSVGASSLVAGNGGALSTVTSLIGVTALILLAKGDVYGQVLTIVFSLLYGVVSLRFHYYGEMITYLGMTAPSAAFTLIEWLRHPYRDSNEVTVERLTAKKLVSTLLISALGTVIFYFILRALGTANLLFSTVSVFTSLCASIFMILRLPHYAIAYACNDTVLIVLWVLATLEDKRYLPIVICFAVFFINDMYGFFSWRAMKKRQRAGE